MDKQEVIDNLLIQRKLLLKTLMALEKSHKQDLDFIKDIIQKFERDKS